MSSVRNWYIYLTSAISLNVVVWALIAMLRNFVARGTSIDLSFLALQIATIIIGLPLYLLHWFWARRLSSNDLDEQQAVERRLYIYSVLAGTLGPILANTFTLIVSSVTAFEGVLLARYLVTVVPLTAIFVYHQRVLAGDAGGLSPTGENATIRRVYIFGFSIVGLWMTTAAIIYLVRWIFFVYGWSPEAILINTSDNLSKEIVRLFMGLVIWIYFSRWAQRLFEGQVQDEQASVLRKFYLYLIIFVTALTTVSTATALLAGIFRRWLGLPPSGDLDTALSYIFGMGLVWAYHGYVLRQDAAAAPDAPRQAGVRRLYLYLVAAIGLAALLIGLIGDLNLLIDVLTSPVSFEASEKRQLAWFTASILSGLPVWILPWRLILMSTSADAPQAEDQRVSTVRKMYLYFYLFVAVMAVLGSLINIVYQFLLLLLGERTSALLLNDLAEAFSYTLTGAVLLGYHAMILRRDGLVARKKQATQLEEFRISLLDMGEGQFGLALKQALASEFPSLSPTFIGLTEPAAQAFGQALNAEDIASNLAEAELIVAPWSFAMGDSAFSGITTAVIASPARKLLIPLPHPGWELAAFDPLKFEDLVHQSVKSIKQILQGEDVKLSRGMGIGSLIAIVIGLFILLGILTTVVPYMFYAFR